MRSVDGPRAVITALQEISDENLSRFGQLEDSAWRFGHGDDRCDPRSLERPGACHGPRGDHGIAPKVKTVGRDAATGAPIQQYTVQARIQYDPVTLTTNSGVALLKESVEDAARRVCASPDPADDDDDGDCFIQAVKSAQPQIDAAIARARKSNPTG